MKYQIIIEIEDDENITMETVGIKGPKCEAELNSVTKDLGKVTQKNRTKEFYEEVKSGIKNKLGSLLKK